MKTTSNAILATIIVLSSCLAISMANTGRIAPFDDETPPSPARIMSSAAHPKISIVGNVQLDTFFAGNSSNGTIGNPYIIQGFEINAGGTGSAIYMANTNKHVIIQGCTLQGSGNTTGSAGIRLVNCTNVIVRLNVINGNAYHGIQVESRSSLITVTRNTITSNTIVGVNLDQVRDSVISSNVISGASNITSTGINVGRGNNITVQQNNISNPIANGIYFTDYVIQSRIIGNYIRDCYYVGITITESSEIAVENNKVTRCRHHGLEIINDSCNSNFTRNLVMGCGFAGIRFYNGNDNITGNKIWYNAFLNNRDSQSLTRWMNPGENDWDVNGIGNYWGDYLERYPNATKSGNIWNTPYAINETTYAEDYDHFPLVSIDLLGTDLGPVDVGWIIAIIVIAFIACAVLVVFKAYKIGVLLPPGFKTGRGITRVLWRKGDKA